MPKFTHYFLISLCYLGGAQLFAHNAGANSDSLDLAIEDANAGTSSDFTVNFTGNVSLISPAEGNSPTQVRALNSAGTFTFVGNNVIVNGNNFNLNGNGNTRGFFVGGLNSSNTGSVTINNLTFNSCRARGGDGGDTGGGGGLGAGGGLFVGKNTVATIKDCTFTTCSAKGGNGDGSAGVVAAGGGGMRGNGGDEAGGAFRSGGGGGAFGGNGAAGSSDLFGGGGGGASGFAVGNGSGPGWGLSFDGIFGSSGDPGNGGQGGAVSDGLPAGFGGGGGGGSDDFSGGPGAFGGGGGGSGSSNPKNGGTGSFGGGGGSTTGNATSSGGAGGFGGGGGADATSSPGTGGFGGGTATSSVGGRGAGFGGAIFLEDGADLTIEGSVNFSGSSAAAADSGIAAVGSGALGQDIFMMSGSQLTFDITSDVILQNPIEGDIGAGGGDESTNGLTKKGSALLFLTGDNTYSGTTTVEAGELRINSSVITPIVVEAGGLLSGNFTAKTSSITDSGNLTNNGRVSPGVSGVGTIILEGEFTQTSGATLVIDITPDGSVHDKILGATSAMLAGTMEVIVNPGNYIAGTQYIVIDAPTNGTKFDTVLEIGGFGKLIDLQVSYSSVIITILNTVLFENQIINSGPPSDVAKCIKEANIIPDSDFALMVETLGILNNSEVNKALTSLSAVRYGALEWINARNNSYAADILSQHLFELCCNPHDCYSCDCNANAWVSVFGNIMDNKKRLDNLRRFNADAVGVLAGIDFWCSPCFYYGAAFGYTHTYLLWRNNGGNGKIDSYYGALYCSLVCDCFSMDISALGGGSENDLKRKITFATVDRTARSDFWGYFATAHLGLKTNWNCGCSTFEPFALADYHYYTHESFKEKGANSLNLNVKSKDQHMIRAEAGLLWYYEADCGCYCYAPYLGLSYVGEFPLNKSKQPASFTGRSCVINATSYDSSVHLGAPQAGVKWTHCNGASILLGYKGLFNNKTHINEIEGRFEWVF